MADWNKKFLPNRRQRALVAKFDAATGLEAPQVRPRKPAKGELVIPANIGSLPL
jgi:hypothetical protein